MSLAKTNAVRHRGSEVDSHRIRASHGENEQLPYYHHHHDDDAINDDTNKLSKPKNKSRRGRLFGRNRDLLSCILSCRISSSSLARLTFKRWTEIRKLHRILLTILFVIGVIHTVILALDAAYHSYGINGVVGNENARKTDHEYSSNTKDSKISSLNASSSSFAVIVNTYKRPKMLHDAVLHYADKCGRKHGVSQVFVVWAEAGKPPDPSSFFSIEDHSINVRGSTEGYRESARNRSHVAVIQVKDSLNSRFLPINDLHTDAVFTVDDDVRVECSSLTRGFEAWTANSDAHVGYYPRWHQQKPGHIKYHLWPMVYLQNKFSIILTKASFLHAKYLQLYSSKSHPQKIRDYIDSHHNCEDIAMSMLVANATMRQNAGTKRSHLVYVEGTVKDLGLFNGISTGSGHLSTRSDCINEFSRIYKEHGWAFPLVDVSLKDGSWLQHFPGFWWQARPSNLFEWL